MNLQSKNSSLIDYLFLSAAVGFFIIGIDQLMRGFTAYWLFMLSVMCLLGISLRRTPKIDSNANSLSDVQAKKQGKSKVKNLYEKQNTQKKKK